MSDRIVVVRQPDIKVLVKHDPTPEPEQHTIIAKTIAGIPGPKGLPGGSYSHNQGPPSADWIVPHDLGYRPAGATVYDSGGTQVEGWIEHIDNNNLIHHFNVPFGGIAYYS